MRDANYLNGQSLSQTLYARQLPYALKTEKPGTATAVHLVYAYDVRRKVSGITDYGHAGNNRSFTYDANGRLLTASGAWGAGAMKSCSCDALGPFETPPSAAPQREGATGAGRWTGAACVTRTRDPIITNDVLYQLS